MIEKLLECFFGPMEEHAPVEFAKWKEKHKWNSWGPMYFQKYYREVEKYKYCEFSDVAQAVLRLVKVIIALDKTTQDAHDDLAIICQDVAKKTNKNWVSWSLGLATIITCVLSSALVLYYYEEPGWSTLMFMYVGGLLLVHRQHFDKIWQQGNNLFTKLFILSCLYCYIYVTLTLKARGFLHG